MIKKEIADKLFKAELSEQQKVEFALIDDLQKISKDFDDVFTEQMRLRTEASQLNRKAKDLQKKYDSLVSDAKQKANDASKKIQDLGLEEPAILSGIYDSFGEDIYQSIAKPFK